MVQTALCEGMLQPTQRMQDPADCLVSNTTAGTSEFGAAEDRHKNPWKSSHALRPPAPSCMQVHQLRTEEGGKLHCQSGTLRGQSARLQLLWLRVNGVWSGSGLMLSTFRGAYLGSAGQAQNAAAYRASLQLASLFSP